MTNPRKMVIGIAAAQLLSWSLLLRAAYAPEGIQQGVMLAAAGLTLFAGLRPSRGAATLAQGAQVAALLVYGAVAAVWALVNPEVIEGLLMLTMTGAILFVVVPPIASVIALHYLKRKLPLKLILIGSQSSNQQS